MLRDFLKAGHWPTLAAAFLYFGVSCMVWLLVGMLGLSIASDLKLSSSGLGLMVAVPILGGALVRIPLGLLVDRVGPRRTAIVCQLLVAIPLTWGWLGGTSVPQLVGIGLLLGIAGGAFAVALPLASRWYPAKFQGLALGIVGAAYVGTGLAAALAPRLAERVGWHRVFGLALLPVAAALALFVLLARESPAPRTPKPLRAYLDILKHPQMLRYGLLYGFTFGGFVGLASVLLILFHDQYALSRVTSGTLAAACVFAGSFMRPVGGFLADRLGGYRILAALCVGASFALAGVALQPPLAVGVALLFTVMACLGAGNGAVFQLVPQSFPKDIGVATGVIGAAGGAAGFLLPILLGVLKQGTGSTSAGFFCLSLAGAYVLALLQRAKAPPAPAPGLAGDLLKPPDMREDAVGSYRSVSFPPGGARRGSLG